MQTFLISKLKTKTKRNSNLNKQCGQRKKQITYILRDKKRHSTHEIKTKFTGGGEIRFFDETIPLQIKSILLKI